MCVCWLNKKGHSLGVIFFSVNSHLQTCLLFGCLGQLVFFEVSMVGVWKVLTVTYNFGENSLLARFGTDIVETKRKHAKA